MPPPEIIKIENISEAIAGYLINDDNKDKIYNDVYMLLLKWWQDGQLELKSFSGYGVLRNRVIKELNKCQH